MSILWIYACRAIPHWIVGTMPVRNPFDIYSVTIFLSKNKLAYYIYTHVEEWKWLGVFFTVYIYNLMTYMCCIFEILKRHRNSICYLKYGNGWAISSHIFIFRQDTSTDVCQIPLGAIVKNPFATYTITTFLGKTKLLCYVYAHIEEYKWLVFFL